MIHKNCSNCIRGQRPVQLFCMSCNRLFKGGKDHWLNPDLEKQSIDYLEEYSNGLLRREQREKEKLLSVEIQGKGED